MRTLALLCLALASIVSAADPTPVEKQLAVQAAMVAGRKYLDAEQSADAVNALEKEVANADGNKAFLSLLREAYLAELYQLEKDGTANADRIATTRRKLFLLGGTKPEAKVEPKKPEPPPAAPLVPSLGPPLVPDVTPGEPAAPTVPPSAQVDEATAAFKRADYAEADKLFAKLGSDKLTPEQKTAWAYSRIKVSADRLNAPTCDSATAAEAARSVSDALELIPNNAKLRAVGEQVLKAAQAKAGTALAVATGDAVETTSFRARGGSRELATKVAEAAEAQRKAIFERWSGPVAGAWQPKCEIVIHATADAYAKATGQPNARTGHATVKLTNSRATERRLDLRADDTTITANALPRELTHVVLADMFGDKPPPRWAAEGMAVLACSPEEISRYTRTLTRCARDGELRSLAALFDLKDVPAEKLTGFYCQSVSVAEYLIALKGDKHFKLFVNDVQRYGAPQALKRQYNIDGPAALEPAWKRASVDVARAQGP
jgi:hypothetical protein